MRPLRLPDARDFLQDRITQCRSHLSEFLAPLEPHSAFDAWLRTFRAIEEFINIPLCELEDKPLIEAMLQYRLDQPVLDVEMLRTINRALIDRFSAEVARRYTQTLLQATAIGVAFRSEGHWEAAAGFETVATAIAYFQSRRRHLLALLHTLPTACRGKRIVSDLETINLFLPAIENFGVPLTELYLQLMLSHVFDDYTLVVMDGRFASNHQLQVLDPLFSEPERMGLQEAFQRDDDPASLDSLEDKDPRVVFSAAETRNSIRLHQRSFERFELSKTPFAAAASFIEAVLRHVTDSYFVTLPEARFLALIDEAHLTPETVAALVNHTPEYVDNTNATAPFICLGDRYVSTLPLLDRFLYLWRSTCLNRIRRFQIHAGFVFEGTVKVALAEQGFSVTEVKRINRKEFDIVAIFEQVIYNVQCKNNLVDYNRVEQSPELIARYSRQLSRYYVKALQKEAAREGLLQNALGLQDVRHVLVSRFPIATTHPRIICLAEIAQFKQRYVY